MRDPKRIDPMLAALKELWVKYPDMRLCQLMLAASGLRDPFYLEDDEFLTKLERMVKEDATSRYFISKS